MKVDRRRWLLSSGAYTLAGATSSSLFGFLAGLVGKQANVEIVRVLAVVALLALVAREWQWISFPLPESKRQTEKRWANEFGFVVASAMWGSDIGLGFVTRMNYGGFWALVVIVLVRGEPQYGALLFLSYWIGRSLSVWLAPALFSETKNSSEFAEIVLSSRTFLKRAVAFGLLWAFALELFLDFGTKGMWQLIAAGRP